MATTVTIDQETQAKLGELKTMLREMGETDFFKRDIVRDVVDDTYADVRHAYYEAKAEPFVREHRFTKYNRVFDYWTRDRIMDELVHEGYLNTYKDEASVDQYLNDIKQAILNLHEWQCHWVQSVDSVEDNHVLAYDDHGNPLAVVWQFPDTSMAPSGKKRGIGNACEIALQRLKYQAEDIVDGETPPHMGGVYILVNTPEHFQTDN